MPSASRPNPQQPNRPLTIKQQRAAQRAAKLEKYHRELARGRRNRRIGIAFAVVGVLAVVGLIVGTVVLTPRPATYQAGSSGAAVPGVETFDNAATHVETPVSYAQTPPAGGDHSATWLNCGVYTEPVPNENAIHALEHGAVWVTYDASEVDDDELSKIRALLPARHAVLSPYEGLDTPVTLSAWNTQLELDSVDEDLIRQFFEEYWIGDLAPEPGASCSGGIDGPGKI